MRKLLPLLTVVLFFLLLAPYTLLASNVMRVPSVTAQPGEVVTVDIEIINSDPFGGFQADIAIPPGFTYVDGSFQLNPERKTDHEFSTRKLSGNVLRVISFSMTNALYLGNDGAVASLKLESPTTQGSYPLNLSSVVISGAAFNNIVTGVEPGLITLELPGEYSLEIDIIGNGSVYVNGINYTVPLDIEEGEVVTLEAFPGIGYGFDKWDGDLTGTATTIQFPMTRDIYTTARFVINSYTLTYAAGPGGSVSGELTQVVEHDNDGSAVEAIADNGYHFVQWSDGVTSNPRKDISVTSDLAVEAQFALNSYSISVEVIPEGGGSVGGAGEYLFGETVTLSASPSSTYAFLYWAEGDVELSREEKLVFVASEDRNLTAVFDQEAVQISAAVQPAESGWVEGAGNYIPGEQVELLAVPAEGYHFVSWTKGMAILGEHPLYSFVAADNRELTANFAINSYHVVLLTEPASGLGGMVKGAGVYDHGDQVRVMAAASQGYEFAGWFDGDFLVSTDLIYDFIITTDLSLTARFESETYLITTGVSPAESGSVSGGGEYFHGETVSLSAQPADGYYLLRWMDGSSQVSVRNPYMFSASGNRNLVAEFAVKWWGDDKHQKENNVLITASVEPEGVGVVLGQGYYEIGKEVTLVASPNEGIEFTAWKENDEVILDANDDPVGPTYVFTAEKDRQLVAVFDGEVYTVTVAANPVSGGEVTVSNQGLFFAGDFAELSATANPGYVFLNWTMGMDGPQLSGSPDFGITVEEDMDLIAHFEKLEEYELALDVYPEGAGAVNGQGMYPAGQEVTISTTPADGFEFIHWRKGAGIFSLEPEVTFVINADMSLVAHYQIMSYTILASAGPNGQIDPSGEITVTHGDTKVFTITPDDFYHVAFIKVDGQDIDLDADPAWDNQAMQYTFESVSGPHTIEAGFAINTYQLVYLAGENGSIVGESQQTVDHGADGAPVEAIPDEGYHFVEWSDGVTDNPRQDVNITSDLEVSAIFELTTYKLTFVVVDVGGDPISDAVITLNDTEAEPGVYVFEGLEPDVYTYKVSKDGYFTIEGEIEIVNEDRERIVVLQVDNTFVADLENIVLNVYPNPASDQINIMSNYLVHELRLVDMVGRIVYHSMPQSADYQFGVSEFRNGIYLLQIRTAVGLDTIRIQISK